MSRFANHIHVKHFLPFPFIVILLRSNKSRSCYSAADSIMLITYQISFKFESKRKWFILFRYFEVMIAVSPVFQTKSSLKNPYIYQAVSTPLLPITITECLFQRIIMLQLANQFCLWLESYFSVLCDRYKATSVFMKSAPIPSFLLSSHLCSASFSYLRIIRLLHDSVLIFCSSVISQGVCLKSFVVRIISLMLQDLYL